MASVFRRKYNRTVDGRKVKKQSKCWYVKYRDAEGIERRVKGFKDKETAFQRRGDALIREHEMGLSGHNPEREVMDLKNCVDVVRWYQCQINVKLVRALMQEEQQDDGEDGFPSDSDGSAKVGLIGIDRSIAAWIEMCEQFPDERDGIIDVLVLLDRIRKRTEQDFPRARSFVRPGFDTEPASPF